MMRQEQVMAENGNLFLAVEGAGAADGHAEGEEHSVGVELGLMGLSLLIAIAGIGIAYKFYVTSPEISAGLAERWAASHRTLSNKYYVDELYGATVISGTFASARGLWTVDRKVVDGAVNGTGHLVRESAGALRLLQTGSVRVYAASLFTGALLVLGYYLAR